MSFMGHPKDRGVCKLLVFTNNRISHQYLLIAFIQVKSKKIGRLQLTVRGVSESKNRCKPHQKDTKQTIVAWRLPCRPRESLPKAKTNVAVLYQYIKAIGWLRSRYTGNYCQFSSALRFQWMLAKIFRQI